MHRCLDVSQPMIRLGADNGYDAKEFMSACLEMGVTPHVALNTSVRGSAMPVAIAATVDYAISQNKRKLLNKTLAGLRLWGACAK